MMSTVEYYRDPKVRRQLRAFAGHDRGRGHGAAYLAGLCRGPSGWLTWDAARRVPPRDASRLCAEGCDIARSLWDLDDLIVLLDLDYLNVDEPAEPYVKPAETFFKLEPTRAAVQRVCNRLGLTPSVLVTGRGYHFTGRLPLSSGLAGRLGALVPGPPGWLAGVDARRPPGVKASLPVDQGRATEGLGRLMEYLAHEVLREAGLASPIPVVLNGTVVGPGPIGRECVSIDISHTGDPLDIRHVRMAFSTYQWHRLRPDIFGPTASHEVPTLVVVPYDGQSFATTLSRGRDCAAGARLARQGSSTIPDVETGVAALLERYERSELARFHGEFDLETARPVPVRPVPADLPPCAGMGLTRPNDLLLKPEFIQQLVRSLMARDWRPAEIAALVRARYEEDHDWGDRWRRRMHARTRAAFDVRVFAGMVRTGMDALVDCNCVSAQEKGVCPRTGCDYDLRRDRDRLRARHQP